MTLRLLASGDCLRSFSYSFRIGHSTISEIVVETCIAVFIVLSPIYLKKPEKRMEEKSDEQRTQGSI